MRHEAKLIRQGSDRDLVPLGKGATPGEGRVQFPAGVAEHSACRNGSLGKATCNCMTELLNICRLGPIVCEDLSRIPHPNTSRTVVGAFLATRSPNHGPCPEARTMSPDVSLSLGTINGMTERR